jgi:hypothetical protein
VYLNLKCGVFSFRKEKKIKLMKQKNRMLQWKITNQLTEGAKLKQENFGMEMDVVTMKRDRAGYTGGQPVEVVCLGRIAAIVVVAAVAAAAVVVAAAAVKTVRKVTMEHGKIGEVVWMLREVARAHLS